MAIGDLYELRISYHSESSLYSNGFGYIQLVGTNDNLTLQSAVDFWVANMLPSFLDMLSVEVEVDQVRMDQVSAGDELPAFTNLVGSPGTVAGANLPGGAAAVISLVTNAPNAKHNGRVYIGGISEDEVNAGNISVAQLGFMNAFLFVQVNDLLTSLPQDAGFQWATISRVLNKAPRVPPVGFLVQSTVARLPFYSQRRRITKRLGIS